MKKLPRFKSLVLLLVVALSAFNTPLAVAREPVRARHGMVASTNEMASRVGVEIMKRGVTQSTQPSRWHSHLQSRIQPQAISVAAAS